MKETEKKDRYERSEAEVIGFLKEDVLRKSNPSSDPYELPVV